MKRLSPKLWTMPLALLALGMAAIAGLSCGPAFAQESNPANDPSWSSSISSGVKSGFNKIGNALNPKPTHNEYVEDDAVSLKTKAQPGPELFVAIAQLYVQSDKLSDAEQQYRLALADKSKPNFLPALLGYAELKERMGQPAEAIQQYQKAVSVYPQEASVHNNMGLCYSRQGRLDEAVSAMTRAVQLAPKNPLYRNNIATILVDQGKAREAFGHLRQVHGEAAAYYNLGYLLNKKGDKQAAIQHFSQALRVDPSMTAAQHWIEYLQRSTTQARLPQHPAATGLRITGERSEPYHLDDPSLSDAPLPQTLAEQTQASAPPSDPVWQRPERTQMFPPPAAREEVPSVPSETSTLPEAPMPRRLPPISREPESDGPSLPGISYNGYGRPTVPTAPLPPPASNNTAVRPLPRVN